jgi:uncharacterized protein YjiS (DUF1127 family)
MTLAWIVPPIVIAGGGAALALAGRCLPDPGARIAAVKRWHDRQRQRVALRALDDRLLRDVGLSRAQAEAEGRRHD